MVTNAEVNHNFSSALADQVVQPEHIPNRKAVRVQQPQQPVDVLALAKSRLRQVKKEIRALKALEKEQVQLERLIAAAEDKKPSKVLKLAKSTG